jgi:phage major head subunit gpT-like protein
MQITPQAIRDLLTGFKTIYQDAYGASEPFWEKLATLVPSNDKMETYGWMTKLPRMREWVGERIVQNAESKAYTLLNKPYELTLELDRDEIEDDRYGVYNPVVSEMGNQAARWPDDLIAAVLQNGTSELAFDDKAFFANDHSFGGNTVDNLFTGTALTAANYATVRQTMLAYKGEDGKPLGVKPNLLVVPPQLEDEAKDILEVDLQINAAGTAAGTNKYKGTASILMLPELANEPTVWYLLDVSRAIKPFVFQQRKAPEFVSKDSLTDDNVFWKKKFVFGVDSRGAAGYTLPFLAARAIA